jgi:large subunit ribosomal protein L25
MVKKITLNAKKRGEESAKDLRGAGMIPAVLYGQGDEAEHIKINAVEFEKTFEKAGESSLIDLTIDSGEAVKTIVKNTQKDAVKDKFMHIDLYRIDMKQPIETEIPIHFEGEAKAEKELGGTITKNLETVHVKCLPGDLVEFFAVDLGKLETFDDVIRVSDIKVGEGQQILSSPEDLIVNVVPPRIITESEEETEEEGEETPEGEAKTDAGEERNKEGEEEQNK